MQVCNQATDQSSHLIHFLLAQKSLTRRHPAVVDHLICDLREEVGDPLRPLQKLPSDGLMMVTWWFTTSYSEYITTFLRSPGRVVISGNRVNHRDLSQVPKFKLQST